MTGVAFGLRGLWFFRRSYFGVLAGSAVGAMVLLGALMAGDSVKATLRQVAVARLGKVDFVLAGGDRLFRAALADDLAVGPVEAAPVLLLQATVTAQRSGRAVGAVQVLGVDRRFWRFAPGVANNNGKCDDANPQDNEFWVNEHLARSLDLGLHEQLVLRFAKPALIARDAPLAGRAADLISVRGDVGKVCDDGCFGRFNLATTQLPMATVFVPIERLQAAIGFAGKANLMLLRDGASRGRIKMLESITANCKLEDYGLTVEDVPLAKAVEVRSARIFFDRRVVAAIQNRWPTVQPVITYLANTLAANGRETPYSMVTAVAAAAAPFLPNKLDGVVLNAWEAEDLVAKEGDEIRLDYYALGGGNKLIERSVRLPVVGVVPLSGLAADRSWLPDFPGVAAAEHAADWDPGMPLDLKRLRAKDEAYWDTHRGAPKLFLSIEKGRELFGNRWGEFTALRVPTALVSRQEVTTQLLESVTPELAGLVLQDVRTPGLAAAASAVDFAGLLLGMSLFLMAAAVALTAMMFRFHIEQRNRESGLLAAVGIPANKIMRWRLVEGLGVVVAGCGAGAVLAVVYTQWLLELLATIWRGVGDGRVFQFQVEPTTYLTGSAAFVLLMMLVIWLVTRQQSQRSVSLRLEAGTEEVPRRPPPRVPWLAVGLAVLGSSAVAGTGWLGSHGAFFLAGLAFLLAGLAGYGWVLRRRAAADGGELTPLRLAQLNCGRRVVRSMVVVGSLACGVFLVVAVAAFRQSGGDEWRDRRSGAGGFAFWVEATNPPQRGTGSQAAADLLDLGVARQKFGQVLPLRVGVGDEASCFNLNQVTHPRLLATEVAVLARLGAFPINKVMAGCARNWGALSEGEVMRAFVDETTLLWVLKKQLGERLIYQDEWGREFPIEIAGTLDGTVFQGSLIVDEARFLAHYPSAQGPRLFLVDSVADQAVGLANLQQSLADQGVLVTTTSERLAAFHGVENTYITIFQVLGGLGVIVGSVGLGLVTARNMSERRYEFAILHTMGVPGAITRRVVMLEAGQFIRWGLGIGWVAAMVSILPLLTAGEAGKSLGWIGLWMLIIAANAWLWSWLGWRRHLGAACSVEQEFR